MGLCRVIVEARNLIEEARTLVEVAREELPPTAQAVRRASAEAGEATAELRALRTLGGDLALKLTASAQAVVEADAGLRSALRAVRSRMRRVMGQAEVGGDSRGGGVWDAGVAPDQAAGAEGDSAACGRAEDADSSSSEEAQRAAGLADLAPRDVAEVIAAGLSSVRDVAAIFTQTSGLSAARAFADGFGLGKKGGGGARDDE